MFNLCGPPPLLLIGCHHTDVMQEGSEWFHGGHKHVHIHHDDQSRRRGSNIKVTVRGRRRTRSNYSPPTFAWTEHMYGQELHSSTPKSGNSPVGSKLLFLIG